MLCESWPVVGQPSAWGLCHPSLTRTTQAGVGHTLVRQIHVHQSRSALSPRVLPPTLTTRPGGRREHTGPHLRGGHTMHTAVPCNSASGTAPKLVLSSLFPWLSPSTQHAPLGIRCTLVDPGMATQSPSSAINRFISSRGSLGDLQWHARGA